jgi:hypothetical protein
VSDPRERRRSAIRGIHSATRAPARKSAYEAAHGKHRGVPSDCLEGIIGDAISVSARNMIASFEEMHLLE